MKTITTISGCDTMRKHLSVFRCIVPPGGGHAMADDPRWTLFSCQDRSSRGRLLLVCRWHLYTHESLKEYRFDRFPRQNERETLQRAKAARAWNGGPREDGAYPPRPGEQRDSPTRQDRAQHAQRIHHSPGSGQPCRPGGPCATSAVTGTCLLPQVAHGTHQPTPKAIPLIWPRTGRCLRWGVLLTPKE